MKRKIDHIVLAVADLDKAADFYEKCGFTITAKSMHPFGTGNRLALLDTAYVELLAVIEPEKIPPMRPDGFSFADFNKTFLDKREGFSMMVISSENPETDHKRLSDNAIETYPVMRFSRKAVIETGEEVEYAFSTIFASSPMFQESAVFFCRHHHQKELFYRPGFQNHENGAIDPADVVLISNTPEKTAEAYETFLGAPSGRAFDGSLFINLENGTFHILSPEEFNHRFGDPAHAGFSGNPVFGAVTFRIKQIETIKKRLEQNGIPFTEKKGAVGITPDIAFGLYLFFTDR